MTNPTEHAGSLETAMLASMGSVLVVVDVANVMGSRPDGWWRDRAGAAARLVASLAALPGRDVDGHLVAGVVAVVEGQARGVAGVDGVTVVAAPADGDTTVVAECEAVLGRGEVPLAVTADRGLRARLPGGTLVAGPRALLDLLGSG